METWTETWNLDVQSLVTVVFSLNRYEEDYKGGLYVRSGGSSERYFIPLHPGRAVIHTSDILHGVDVMSGERWSYIFWLSNHVECDPKGSKFFHIKEANQDDPMAMFLHAKRFPLFSSPSFHVDSHKQAMWMKRAADSGFARAMNEIGLWCVFFSFFFFFSSQFLILFLPIKANELDRSTLPLPLSLSQVPRRHEWCRSKSYKSKTSVPRSIEKR